MSVSGKQMPVLYQQYKENMMDKQHYEIDLMKFLEVHKKGIDFYNSYGLQLEKKEPKPKKRTAEDDSISLRNIDTQAFYENYFKNSEAVSNVSAEQLPSSELN